MNAWNIADQLEELRAQGLWRELRPLDEVDGVIVRSGGREWVNFSSNDYLGLAGSQELRAALEEGVAKYGAGSGASRLVCGTHRAHAALEEALADFKGTEAALTFSSGFAVALGTIPALVGAGDTIILDKLCHASLVDAARPSGCSRTTTSPNSNAFWERPRGACWSSPSRFSAWTAMHPRFEKSWS
jgi:7-keto-8-aminopelargonate synthetase-like enzyme